MVKLTIDGKEAIVQEGTTILEAAASIGIIIPTLCYLKEINEISACRICVVEVDGFERLVPACTEKVTEGMSALFAQAEGDNAPSGKYFDGGENIFDEMQFLCLRSRFLPARAAPGSLRVFRNTSQVLNNCSCQNGQCCKG